ncbi:uncharacterized protein LOC128198641 [Bicyclus anynana]|uniref:Gustatory receptor n=1 Tax=Bicyclus anynana TaxID=110368 RepID=A0ABM3LPH7_BICAN|nr:uncharacterized protein LOC128198641 [Bicyclus anynana]
MKGTKLEPILFMLRPIIIIENIFGKFRYRKLCGNIDTINKTMKCYAILTLLVPVTMYIINFANTVLYNTFTETDNAVDVVDEVSAMVTVIQHIISTIMFLYYSENNVRIIKLIVDIDNILNISHNKQTYKDSRKRIQIIISLITFIYLFAEFFNFLVCDSASLVREAIILFIDFERHLEVLSFCIFITTIKNRVQVVNSHLEQVIKIKHQSHVRDIAASDLRNQTNVINIQFAINNHSIIHTLATSYDLIGEACNEINKTFNFNIFRALVSTFMYIIITIWATIYDIGTTETSKSLTHMISTCIIEILSVILMSYTCEIMLLKRKSTMILVNEIVMDYELTRQMRIQAKAFMELIELWSLKIYAHDMFIIDIKLLLKFISVSTTYLIVLIQVSHFF